jgi:4,5-dihydroxyphthalate decarboxylase
MDLLQPRRNVSLAIQRFDRHEALHTRVVTVDDVLVSYALPSVSVIGLMNGTFDAAEMPLAHYAFLRSIGAPYTALPVFPDRIFPHQYIYTRLDTGIRSLADLSGRRVGIPMYFMTLSFWHRALLREAYGIEAHEIEWHTTSDERDRRQRLPAEIRVIPNPGPHLGLELLLDGTVDCLMTEGAPLVPPERRGDVVPVLADATAAQRAWFRESGCHPIVHTIVLRQEVVDARPEIVEELCDAFDRAKQASYYHLQNERTTGLPLMRGYLDETVALFGEDPWPYGVAGRNGAELDRFLGYAHADRLTERRLTLEELFDPPAREFPFRARMVPGADLYGLPSLLGYLPSGDPFPTE